MILVDAEDIVGLRTDYDPDRALPLCKVLEPTLILGREGTVENLESQVELLTEVVGKLLATMVINDTITVESAAEITNLHGKIIPLRECSV